jgi:uncharacterized small protein (DUF1192 family)
MLDKAKITEEILRLEAELKNFYTVKEAARELGLAVPALRSRVYHKTVLAVQAPSGKILIPRTEIERLLIQYGDPDVDLDEEIAQLRQEVS